MKLHELSAPAGARPARRRLGRGLGSGRGKTAGKGAKGQKARSGGSIPPYFEGGQLPLVRRLPYRRGFRSLARVEYEVVNLDQLDRFPEGEDVTPDSLRAARLVRNRKQPVKVLARGTITKPLIIHAHAFSASARAALESGGGSTVELSRA